MAQTNRVVGDIGVLTIGGANYSAVVKNVTLEVEISTRDNSAVNDVWSWPKELRRASRLTWSVAAEDDDALAVLSIMCNTVATPGTVTGIAFDWKPYSGAAHHCSGVCIMTRGSQSGDDEQSRSFEALPQGPVVWAAT